MIDDEARLCVQPLVDEELARRALRSSWGHYAVMIAVVVSTTIYRDMPVLVSLAIALSAVQAVLRFVLIGARKKLSSHSPSAWRRGIYACLLSIALLWSVLSGRALLVYGYDHHTTLLLVCYACASAMAGVHTLACSVRAAAVYHTVILSGCAYAFLMTGTLASYGMLACIGILFIYLLGQSRSLHAEYWRGISDNCRLQAKTTELRAIALQDALTGLPNRVAVKERARELQERGGTPPQLAVLYIDLDRFKYINDTHSHRLGDLFLIAVSQRISRCLKSSYMLARMGGDEFVVIIETGAKAATPVREAAFEAAESILRALRLPLDLAELKLSISTSIGVCIAPESGADLETLQKRADLAMYQAKRLGGNRIELFSPALEEKFARAVLVERALCTALETGGLSMRYQPQFDLGGTLVGLEALARLDALDIGPIAPSEFIAVAEEKGLIAEIGDWVLEEVCRQMVEWRASGLPDIRVAVNVSAAQFSPEFAGRIASIAASFGVDLRLLEFEVTETVLMRDLDDAVIQMSALRKLGVHFSVDDFGVGYSSLSYLHKLPLDTLKIDRSFVDGLTPDGPGRPVVESIIALGRSLRLSVIAEGVETRAQFALLCELGCRFFQGFFFSRPLAPHDIADLLARCHPNGPASSVEPLVSIEQQAQTDLLHLSGHI